MPARLVLLPRFVLWMAAVLCLTALLLGRKAAGPEPDPGNDLRTPAAPRYRGLSDQRLHTHAGPPLLLDQTTGVIAPCTFDGMTGFVVLGCSPWRDESGQHHLMIFYQDTAGAGANETIQGFGLARCAYPRAEILERFTFDPSDPLPIGPVAWFPDRTDRILFVAGDGRIYRCMVPSHDGSMPRLQIRPIEWGCDPPGMDSIRYARDLCWPSEPGLGGRLLVSLSFREASSPDLMTHLWCLQMSPDGTTILDAHRLIESDIRGREGPEPGERLPSVGMTREGRPVLAYLRNPLGGSDWELWVAPISADDAVSPSRIRAPAGQKLAGGCVAMAPVFSSDGEWVYARIAGPCYGSYLQRFPVKL